VGEGKEQLMYANDRVVRPEKAARKIANAIEAVQDGNHPHSSDQRAVLGRQRKPCRYGALIHAISRGWLSMHGSGTCVKFTQARGFVRVKTRNAAQAEYHRLAALL